MRKDFGSQSYFFPLPVLIIGTYDKNGVANAMNAAWGTMYDYNTITIALADHKTTDNINLNKCFTVSFATKKLLAQSDYVGIVSGNQVPNKVEVCGLKVQKSDKINAPIFTDYPVSLECELVENNQGTIVAKIVNVSADESVLTNGKIDIQKVGLICYNPVDHTYYETGKEVGKAFQDGKKYIK